MIGEFTGYIEKIPALKRLPENTMYSYKYFYSIMYYIRALTRNLLLGGGDTVLGAQLN